MQKSFGQIRNESRHQTFKHFSCQNFKFKRSLIPVSNREEPLVTEQQAVAASIKHLRAYHPAAVHSLVIPLEIKQNNMSYASLSHHPAPIPAFSPLALLRPLPGLPCHSSIALRPVFSISCRLQLCSSFLCSLLVRYRYRFSL